MLTCLDFWKAMGYQDDRFCCSSCHEDHIEGYFPLLSVFSIHTGKEVGEACCQVVREMEELPQDELMLVFKKLGVLGGD